MQYANNIEKIWNEVNEQEFDFGLNWYSSVYKIAAGFGGNVMKNAGIIAALSPRCEWTENLKRAKVFFETGVAVHTSAMTKKVYAIDALENPTENQILEILNGPKIKSFFINILDPDRPGYVTIDSHAASIAGVPMTKRAANLAGMKNPPRITPKLYKSIADAYREFESDWLLANQIQAITWTHYKNNYATSKKKAFEMS